MSKTMTNLPRKRVRLDVGDDKLKKKKETDEYLSEEGSGSDNESASASEGGSNDEEEDDEEAILQANEAAHKKKPRRRAVNTTRFGASLTGLLEAPPQKAKLRAPKGEKHPILEERARRIAAQTRHEQLECAHVKDVIGGWVPRPTEPFSEWVDGEEAFDSSMKNKGGAVKEKELRRTAQRGVVKLFNAIRAAQGAAENDVTPVTTSKPIHRTPGANTDNNTEETARGASNILGARGRNAALSNMSRDAFLALIERGGK